MIALIDGDCMRFEATNNGRLQRVGKNDRDETLNDNSLWSAISVFLQEKN